MPDRLVRDELLTSERYWRCSPEARNLFLSILLTADDAARMSGSIFGLQTKCMAGSISYERVQAILLELIDADLVRQYIVDGKPFLFVPRFRQRMRYQRSSKCPPPPSEISDLTIEKSDLSQTQVRLRSDSSRTQDERREVKRSEEKRNTTTSTSVGTDVDAPTYDSARKLAATNEPRSPKKREPKIAALRLDAPTEQHRQIARERGVDCDVEFAAYRDWLSANGRVHKDEVAGFRNWLRRAVPNRAEVAARRTSTMDILTGRAHGATRPMGAKVVRSIGSPVWEQDEGDVGGGGG